MEELDNITESQDSQSCMKHVTDLKMFYKFESDAGPAF